MKEIKVANILKSESHTVYIAQEQKSNVLGLGSFVWIKDKYNISIGIIVDTSLYNPIMMGFSTQQESLEYYIPDHQLDSDNHLTIQLIGYQDQDHLEQSIPNHKHILGAGVYQMNIQDILAFHKNTGEFSLTYLKYLTELSDNIQNTLKKHITKQIYQYLDPSEQRLLDIVMKLETFNI